MSPQFGRCALRSYPLSSYTIQCRVNFRPVVFQRVAAAYHIETGGQQLLTHSVPFSKAHICAQRNYATRPASRPKAHTGRTISSPRKKKSSVTVAPDEGSTKTVTVKTGKPKATTGAKAKPKAKTKAKPKVKTRATVKAKTKAKPARKVKKVKKDLSEEQLAKAAKTEQNTKIRELKKVALRVPKLLPSTAYTAVASELAKGTHALEGRAAAEKYRNLIPEELEHFNRIANENKVANEQTYRTWIESFTPDEIRKANNARRTLKRLGVKGYNVSLRDERQVKRPVPAHSLFVRERHASGDMHGMSIGDSIRLIMKEWKALSDSEKQAYRDQHAQSRERYVKEVKQKYGREARRSPSEVAVTPAPAAAPAAAPVAAAGAA